MSRVGSKPIGLPAKVSVESQGQWLKVSGPKGTLTTPLPLGISCRVDKGNLSFERANDERCTRATHGLARALAANAIAGVTQGFEKRLSIVGVGFRAAVKGRMVQLNLGFSHPVDYAMPEGVDVKVEENTRLVVTGTDKQAVGQCAAELRALRPPDAYKGKGIRLADEQIRLKAGKTGAR